MKLLKKFYRLFRSQKEGIENLSNQSNKEAKSFFNNLYSSDDDIGYC